MAIFIDASALTSIIVGEDDANLLERRLDNEPGPCTSAIALWEAALAVSRIKKVGVEAGWAEVERFVNGGNLVVRDIGRSEAVVAIDAQRRYGRASKHPAKLNMGDCFAYACAKTNKASLLYKGDDFIHTDLA